MVAAIAILISAYKGKNNNSIYDLGSLDLTVNNDNDNDNRLPYEPTAVLTSQRNTSSRKPFSIYDILGLDLREE